MIAIQNLQLMSIIQKRVPLSVWYQESELKAFLRQQRVYRKMKFIYLLPACNKITGARGCLTIQLFANLEQDILWS